MTTNHLRPLGIALYIGCLGILLTVGFLAILGQRRLHRGIVYGRPPPIPLAALYPYGVNVALEQYSPATRDQILTQLEKDGLRWLRQVLPWDQIEPQPGTYTWSPWDEIIADAAQHQLDLILVIDGAPAWARPAPEMDRHTLPTRPADLALFVQQVVTRYGSQIKAIEIWQDPNLAPATGELHVASGPDPRRYTQYLKAAYEAAKATHPTLVVLNAGLAPTTENSRRATSDLDFLAGMYRAGAAPYFDALAARPLGFWSHPEDRRTDPQVLNFSRVILLRETMERYGDRDKAVWAVAFGWNALPEPWAGPPSPWGTDDPLTQAERTVAAVRRAESEWPWMGPLLAFHLDPAAPPDDPVHGFALLDDKQVPRPAYRALVNWIAQRLVGIGYYPPDAWFVDLAWQPIPGATVSTTSAGEIVISRPSPHPRFYLLLTLLLATAGVVAWRLDRLMRLPRWELGFAITTVVFLLSTWQPLTWLAVGVWLVLFVFRLDLGLALTVFFSPFYRTARSLGPRPISVLELLTWLALAAWLLRTVLRTSLAGPSLLSQIAGTVRTGLTRITRLDYAVVFLVLASLISPLAAELKGVALHELRVVVLDSALLYFLIRMAGLSRQQLWRLLDALVLAGSMLALYGFYQYIFSGDVIVAEGVRRMRSVYPSPNNLSLFLGRIVPLTGVVLLWGTAPWRRRLYTLASLALVPALFLTFSRAAWLVGLPATVLFVGLVRGRRALQAALVLVVLAGLSILPFAGTTRIRSLVTLAPGSSTYRRLKLWQATLHMIRDHPLLGVGLDNFLYQYRDRYILAGARDDPDLSHPHNLILDFWVRLGIPGLVALAWILVAFADTCRRLYRQLDRDGQVLVLGLAASMFYAIVHGLLDNSYFLVDLAYVFMLTLGVISVQDATPA